MTMTYTGELTVVTCWCGTQYAISADLYNFMRRKLNDGEKQPDVYCPLGHTWIISGEGKVKRLERQLANREEDLRAERAAHATTKGALTKLRKRAERGVCPCCSRSFVDVARHMKSKHPEVVATPERVLP